MSRFPRVPFVATVLAAVALAAPLAASAADPPAGSPVRAAAPVPDGPPDRIWFGGTIVTVDDARPRAEAVAAKDGRIVYVGSRAGALDLRGPSTDLVHLNGRTMLPGFVDAHGRMSRVGLQSLSADLRPASDGRDGSIPALVESLRGWAARSTVPAAYGVVLGWGYDEAALKEGRHPTRDDLDRLEGELPVLVMHVSGRIAVLNSRGLETLGIGPGTPDPEGGRIRRRAGSDVPDGVLEGAAAAVAATDLILAKAGPAQVQAMLLAGERAYLSRGFTTAQESAAERSHLESYAAAVREDALTIDVVAYPDAATADPLWLRGPYHRHDYTRGFRVGGIAWAADGPIDGRPVGQVVDRAFARGWQVLARADGPAALDRFLDAVEQARREHPGSDDRRPVAIGARGARPGQLRRMKALGVVPSFAALPGDGRGDARHGVAPAPGRAPEVFAASRAPIGGLRFTVHHDAPAGAPDAIGMLAAAVNPDTPGGTPQAAQRRVPPGVAIRALTLWGAYQHFEEASKGSIEVGKVADFVVLDANPLTVPRARLADVTVVRTIKAGRTVWSRDP